MNGDYTKITPKLKKVYKELFNEKIPEDFHGVSLEQTLQIAAEKYHLYFVLYLYDEIQKK
jgi:hypothetical protein